jgi:hypothetical protein
MTKAKQKTVGISIVLPMSVDQLVDAIGYDFEFNERLIKALDANMQDWGFTERLFKHFKGEMKKLSADEKKLGLSNAQGKPQCES